MFNSILLAPAALLDWLARRMSKRLSSNLASQVEAAGQATLDLDMEKKKKRVMSHRKARARGLVCPRPALMSRRGGHSWRVQAAGSSPVPADGDAAGGQRQSSLVCLQRGQPLR